MIMKSIVFLIFFLFSMAMQAQKSIKIKPTGSLSTSVPEPSDLSFNAKTNRFFVVSDNGILFETDEHGKVLRKKSESNCDYEAVCHDEKFVYAVDETHRDIHLYDINTLEPVKTINVPYQGGRNVGYEAITFNPAAKSIILVTEKSPIMVFELDSNFRVSGQHNLSKMARDISAATFHDSFLWLLSDEDRMLIKLDPQTYKLCARWELPLINPEGLTFDANGNLVISCDDMQRIYYFNNPEK